MTPIIKPTMPPTTPPIMAAVLVPLVPPELVLFGTGVGVDMLWYVATITIPSAPVDVRVRVMVTGGRTLSGVREGVLGSELIMLIESSG